jgi:RNA polymerase sigma-70 factor (ECF subfamily)
MRDSELAQLVATAQATWPRIEVSAADFGRYLEERGLGEEIAPTLVGELYLACACAQGNRAALAELDGRYLSLVPLYVARIDASPEFADDVRQLLRERLLVAADGKPARIGEYGGKGPLGAWLRVVAVRIALNLVRGRAGQPRTGSGDEREPVAESRNPEHMLVKAEYRAAFQKALESTVADLDSDDRTILRLYYLDGMTVVEIGKLLRLHHSTAARRIERCHETILEKTRVQLGEDLRLDGDEVNSIIRQAQSQVDVSLRQLLQTRSAR